MVLLVVLNGGLLFSASRKGKLYPRERVSCLFKDPHHFSVFRFSLTDHLQRFLLPPTLYVHAFCVWESWSYPVTHIKTRGSCGTAFLDLCSTLLFQAWSLTEPGAWHLGWTAWPASPWDPPVSVLSARGLQCYPVQCCRDPGVT